MCSYLLTIPTLETRVDHSEKYVDPPDLFATVVMNEPRISDDVPWPLHHLFKMPVLAQNYVWHDTEHSIWVEGDTNGVCRIKDYITQML